MAHFQIQVFLLLRPQFSEYAEQLPIGALPFRPTFGLVRLGYPVETLTFVLVADVHVHCRIAGILPITETSPHFFHIALSHIVLLLAIPALVFPVPSIVLDRLDILCDVILCPSEVGYSRSCGCFIALSGLDHC